MQKCSSTEKDHTVSQEGTTQYHKKNHTVSQKGPHSITKRTTQYHKKDHTVSQKGPHSITRRTTQYHKKERQHQHSKVFVNDVQSYDKYHN
jgi:hypothetical protein